MPKHHEGMKWDSPVFAKVTNIHVVGVFLLDFF